jgi:hypothetical protein
MPFVQEVFVTHASVAEQASPFLFHAAQCPVESQ